MPRERSPSREKAKVMYLNSKGQMKLKDIAAELGVLDTQIRKWKSTDKWEDELKGTLPKDKRNVTNKKVTIEKEPKLAAVTDLENAELTDKQRLFCIYYIKYWNKGKAAQKAGYECSYPNGYYEIGCKLYKKTQVREEIEKHKKELRENTGIEAMAVFQKYIDVAFSDINDFMEYGQKELPMLNPISGEPLVDEKGKPMTYTINYADFKSSSEVDGTLISEISKGKDGAKLKLQDKMKALDWLADRLDLLTLENRERLGIEKQKLEIAKQKLEIDKQDAAKGNKPDKPIEIVIKRKGEAK